jgi:hypothetical protein
VEPSSITDSKQACFAGIAAPIFQEEADGLLPLVTRCENSLFEEKFLPNGCFQNKERGENTLYRPSYSNLIQKGQLFMDDTPLLTRYCQCMFASLIPNLLCSY